MPNPQMAYPTAKMARSVASTQEFQRRTMAARTPAKGTTTPMRFAVRSARVIGIIQGGAQSGARLVGSAARGGPVPVGFLQMPSLAEVLRPELPAIAEEIIEAIRRQVADYDRPLKGEFGRNVRQGVEFALGRFLDEREGRGPGLSLGSRDVYVALGRGEFQQGRSLDA